jgi:radical SAM superfamily enzyme YgiQ (UPF0313 family)
LTLLLTPPFTQLNTPYPATAYIKGFLNTLNVPSYQSDLGMEVIWALFSKRGLTDLFAHIEQKNTVFSPNAQRILALREQYIQRIDAVILFLQGKNPTFAHSIAQGDFLPEAARFEQLDDLEWAFGSMGTQDKAKHLATLFLEDISDLIRECADPHFGFSRYAERLGRSANRFDELYEALQGEYSYIDALLVSILATHVKRVQPTLVAITVPFPGNLFAAFRAAQWIKKHFPNIKIAMGGGFANTELRSVSDVRVFEFFDFITLDDGETPLAHLLQHLDGKRPVELLKRTFTLQNGEVAYCNLSLEKDVPQAQVGTPDYSDLWLDKYISVIELVNPMHRMWSDGRWNKLTMAHGCYWGKCTFCDISLAYIAQYEPIAAKTLCDRIETLVAQTGETGFHFVDEAAPPALMRSLALEILRRKLNISWWTNIRFEKSFSRDLCLLLRASGCIAVSGGLEVASDRLLALIEKGVTVAQVAQVTRHFTEAGVMVHAYLMYGFPTQTAQETIDSLEMVRQMFAAGVLQSGFWHQFAMTAHSPVGMMPEAFGVQRVGNEIGTFANNDLVHLDPKGTDHEAFSYGLKKSLLNFMHGIGLDYRLQDWFDFKTPKTKIAPQYIEQVLAETPTLALPYPTAKIVFLGALPSMQTSTKTKKGQTLEQKMFTFHDQRDTFSLSLAPDMGDWWQRILPKLTPNSDTLWTFQQLQNDFAAAELSDFEVFWFGKMVATLREKGMLLVL